MAPKVTVSIVNYNTRHFLDKCLPSVMAQSYPDTEVVLVDNGSADGSVEYVRAGFPTVKIIENKENLMFCKGQNQGMRAGSGEYVLALNSDVVLDRDFIAGAVKAMEMDERTGSVSGRILRMDGKRIDTTGLFLGRSRKSVERGYGEADRGQYAEPGYVFGAGGAAPLYRRAMLEDIAPDGEYFDESYGMFCEDLDLAWRAARRGWRAYYTPRAVAYHARGGTARTEKTPGFMSGYALASLPDTLKAKVLVNRWMTIIKNDRPLDFLLNLPFILLYDIKVWAYLALFAPGAIPLFLRDLKLLRLAWRRRKTF